jgi:hypothetical protein
MEASAEGREVRPSRLWRQMSAEQRLAAAEAFWLDSDLALDQAQAVSAIARHINFRPRSVAALPIARKSRHLAALPALSEPLIERLLIIYHLRAQRPMMAAFLEHLGIGHEEGLITEEKVAPRDRSALAAAARALSTGFPPRDVALYLGTLLAQDPETWEGLAGLPELSPEPAGG